MTHESMLGGGCVHIVITSNFILNHEMQLLLSVHSLPYACIPMKNKVANHLVFGYDWAIPLSWVS